MKKSLAVICALAVLLTSICGTFMLASANDTTNATDVVLPSNVSGATANGVENTLGIPF